MLYANILCLGNEIFGSFCFWLIPSGETLDLSLTNVLLDYKSTDHLAPIHVAWKETIVKSELQLTHEFSTWNKMSILVKQLGEGEFQSSRLAARTWRYLISTPMVNLTGLIHQEHSKSSPLSEAHPHFILTNEESRQRSKYNHIKWNILI